MYLHTYYEVCIVLISSTAILQVGFDVSQFINEDDTITATINNNDNEQTIKLYIISGVPEDTVFETQTRKEIR